MVFASAVITLNGAIFILAIEWWEKNRMSINNLYIVTPFYFIYSACNVSEVINSPLFILAGILIVPSILSFFE